MARVRYREKIAMVYAIQYDGTNLAELEEFTPGNIMVIDGKPNTKNPIMPINVTDWLIDDPYIGYIKPITNAAFQARFDPTPV
jgi:hypothetical protein